MINQQTPPKFRFIMHVGPGIGGAIDGMTLASARARLSLMMERESSKINGASHPTVVLPIPDALTSPRKAAMDTLTAFSKVIRSEGEVFSVAILNQDVANEVLNSVVDVGFLDAFVMCLHRGDDLSSYTTHALDRDGCMIDWTYGILGCNLDERDLRQIGLGIA